MAIVPVSRQPRQIVVRQPIRRAWWRPALNGAIVPSNVSDRNENRSLIASAQRLLSTKVTGIGRAKAEAWMIEAWTMFDLVGELHFLATTLARRAARARFYIGTVNGNTVTELEPLVPGEAIPPAKRNEQKARALFGSLGDGFLGIQEIVERSFVNQFIVGANYMVGAPIEVWNLGMPSQSGVAKPALRPITEVPVGQLVWKTLSVNEFRQVESGYELHQKGSQVQGLNSIMIPGAAAYVITLWNSHPADLTVPDSPVRATLPVLRELVGLTQHVSAQIDSRLAGAGILLMRSSASRAIKRSLGIPEDDERDPFTELLIDAMVTPISDRDSASAVVPLVITIPDESEKPEYMNFSAPLDQYASDLREEAIRRIALGLDAPPELLLGQGDSNHWSAWLTAQEVVDAHIAPTLALISRALTTEFLRPILRANGVSAAEAETYAIWFDTADLVTQANRGPDSQALYGLGLLSDESTRAANGFDESDAPKKTDNKEAAIDLVKQMVVANPGLMNRPGLDVLTDQMTNLLNGTPQSGIAASQQAVASSGSAQIGTPSPAPAAAPAAPAAITAGAGRADSAATPGQSPAPAVPNQGVPQTRAAAIKIEAFAAERYGKGFGEW